MRYDGSMRDPCLLCLILGVAALAGCAAPSAAERALIARSQLAPAPALLPHDQLDGLTGGAAEAAGALLAARASALHDAAAEL